MKASSNKWIALVGCVVVALYVGISGYNYFSPGLAADEIAYFVWATHDLEVNHSHGFLGPLFRTNITAYGATYWTVYENFILLFGSNAIWAMRFVAFVASMSIPIGLILVGNRTSKESGWLVAALWLTMPFAWWSGKINGPETIAMACIVYAILLLHLEQLAITDRATKNQNRMLVAWFLLGFAIAIKLTMLPAIVFAFALTFPFGQKKKSIGMADSIKTMAKVGLSSLAGFLVGGPNVLFNTRDFIAQIKATPSGAPWDRNIAISMLDNDGWGWDGVFSGGLIQWSCAPVVFVILAIAAIIRPRILFASVVAFLACWTILASKGSMLGWYWFGWITLIAPAVLWMYQSSFGLRWISIAVVVGTIVNGSLQYTTIYEQIDSKKQQAGAIAALPKLNQIVNQILSEKQFDLVLDHSEITYENGLKLQNTSESEIVRTSPPSVWKLSKDWDEYSKTISQAEFARCKLGILSEVFSKLLKLSETGSEGKTILILMSKRLTRSQPYHDIDSFLKEKVVSKSPIGTFATLLLDLPHTAVYEIRTITPRPEG